MAYPVDLPFGLWTRVGRRMHKFNRIRQVAPICPGGRTRCRHLSNNIEPSVYGGDAPYVKLECGQMPNVMVALPNTGGALCSTPQSLADAHYWSAVQ